MNGLPANYHALRNNYQIMRPGGVNPPTSLPAGVKPHNPLAFLSMFQSKTTANTPSSLHYQFGK